MLSKIVFLQEAKVKIKQWKIQGYCIGYTNGCFDLLHSGHLSLLKYARQVCDRLIVGLSSDAAVASAKGVGRPIQSVESRSELLESLYMTDLIVIVEEGMYLPVIEHLRPDVFIKGADYTIDKIWGASFVQSYGGEVLLAPFLEGYSTTATLEKIRSKGKKLT